MNFSPLLAVHHLTIAFPGNFPAQPQLRVKDVTFAIHPREIVAIVGESGSGKSLTSLAIGRLLPPDAIVSGKICWRDENVLNWPQERLQRWRGREIASIFQEPMSCFNPLIRVGSQISEAIDGKKMSASAKMVRVLQWLSRIGFPDPRRIYDAFPWELSGGMQQRAMIAMATINLPQLLLADEPTTSLDSQSQANVLQLLLELRSQLGLAILLVTHDLRLARHVADRILVMNSGEIVEENDPETLFSKPLHPYTRQLLAAIPRLPL